MIVSFEHRFLFVAVPKTGTQTVREVLRPRLGIDDWEQCSLFVTKRFPVTALADIGHGHLSCRQLQPFVIGSVWDSLHRFCFVRNPFDRFVSYCTFFHRQSDAMSQDSLQTMKRQLSDSSKPRGHGHAPQASYVTNECGELMVHDVLRYERFRDDLQATVERFGLRIDSVPVRNATPRDNAHAIIDDELRDMIIDYYAVDFDLFGYSHDVPTGLTR